MSGRTSAGASFELWLCGLAAIDVAASNAKTKQIRRIDFAVLHRVCLRRMAPHPAFVHVGTPLSFSPPARGEGAAKRRMRGGSLRFRAVRLEAARMLAPVERGFDPWQHA